jgi:hypothetical protein
MNVAGELMRTADSMVKGDRWDAGILSESEARTNKNAAKE